MEFSLKMAPQLTVKPAVEITIASFSFLLDARCRLRAFSALTLVAESTLLQSTRIHMCGCFPSMFVDA